MLDRGARRPPASAARLRRRGRLTDVVDQLIAETAGSWPRHRGRRGGGPDAAVRLPPRSRVRPHRHERRGQLRRGRRPQRPAAASATKRSCTPSPIWVWHRLRSRESDIEQEQRADKHHVPGQWAEPRAGVPARPDAAAGRRRRVGRTHRGAGPAGQGAQRVSARHLLRAGHRRRRRHRASGAGPGARIPLDGPAVARRRFARTSAAPTWSATGPEIGWCSRTTCASRRAPPTRSSTGGCCPSTCPNSTGRADTRRRRPGARDAAGNPARRGAAAVPADEPSVALLSAGWEDSAWFEHTFLAEEMGIALVQSSDLSVRDGKLLRHIGSDTHADRRVVRPDGRGHGVVVHRLRRQRRCGRTCCKAVTQRDA